MSDAAPKQDSSLIDANGEPSTLSGNIETGGLYLERITIHGFRSFERAEVPLRPGLTVVVGENNAGKSNLIDAIRLSTDPLGGRRTRYFQQEDMRHGWTEHVVISGRFSGATWAQRARLLKGLDISTGEVEFATRFEIPPDPSESVAVKRLAGPALVPAYERSSRAALVHVYVPPLRDAKRDLDTASAGRIAAIMAHLVGAEDRKDLQQTAQRYFSKLAKMPAIRTPERTLGALLSKLTEPVAEQVLSIGFNEPTERRLAAGLRMQMADSGFDPEDLASSGSGYANLLYLASIILELARVKESELTLLLVEEPEAHLHPQLQGVLLDFLRSNAKPGTGDGGLNMGRVQVVVTTHSPNLASAAGIEEILILKRAGKDGLRPKTSALALWDLTLDSTAIGKLDRYLTATRSGILFSKRVLLVEGISEMLLLPALAQSWARQNLSGEARDRAIRSLAGMTLVATDSTDFAPYVQLLLGSGLSEPLADLVHVVTDGDPDLSAADLGSADAAGLARRTALETLAAGLGRAGQLVVSVGTATLEADFILQSARNAEIAKAAYLAQHPRSQAKWDAAVDGASSIEIYRQLKGDDLGIHKGRFAQDLAASIAAGEDIDVPTYLLPYVRTALRVDL